MDLTERRALHAALYELAEQVWNEQAKTGNHDLRDVVDAVAEAEREHCIGLATDAIDTAVLVGRRANNARVITYLRQCAANAEVFAPSHVPVFMSAADEIEALRHIPCTCGECDEHGSQ